MLAMPNISNPNFSTIVVQVEGVIMNLPHSAIKAIPVLLPSLKRLQSTSAWMRYQCNEIEEQQCYELLGKQFGFDASELSGAISTIREMIEYDKNLVSEIHQIKSDTGGLLNMLAVWNIAKPDHDYIFERWGSEFLDDFDNIFTSFAAGARMPHIGFYHQFLTSTKTDPTKAVFVGSDIRDIVAARSLGMRGIMFNGSQELSRTLLNIISDPVTRGNAFIQRNAKNLQPFTDCGTPLLDNYVQLLILEVTGDEYYCIAHIPQGFILTFFCRELVVYKKPEYAKGLTWNYYIGTEFHLF